MFEMAEAYQRQRGGRVSFGSSHFDRREKSFLDPSRSLRIGDLNPSLGVLCVFARAIVFRCRKSTKCTAVAE